MKTSYIYSEQMGKNTVIYFHDNMKIRSYDVEYLISILKFGKKINNNIVFYVNPGETEKQLKKLNFHKIGVIFKNKKNIL